MSIFNRKVMAAAVVALIAAFVPGLVGSNAPNIQTISGIETSSVESGSSQGVPVAGENITHPDQDPNPRLFLKTVTPEQVLAMFRQAGVDPAQHADGIDEDPQKRLERIAEEINSGLRTEAEVRQALTSLAAGQQQWDQQLSIEEIVERVRGFFEASGVPIQTSIESGKDRLERIAGQIATGERTLPEVEQTIKGIAAGPTTTQPVPTTTQPVPTTTQPVPTTVVVSGGVLVRPGESIQGKVDAHPGGTLFVIGAGVHRGQEVRPKAGDTFVGEPGAVLDGGGQARWAFAAGVPNVTIRGLVVQNYATPSREGVIQWVAGGSGWLVEGNEVRDNAEIGIRASSGWRVVDNYVHDNGRYGITGGGSGLVVEGNEIAHNAVVYGATGDSSGTKFAHTVGLVLRDNYVHDNFGNGLWVDINNLDVLIEGNRSVGNTRQGIFYEISCAGVIRNNYVEGNGFDGSNPNELIRNGILVANSSNVEVYGNTVVNNANGIGLLHWAHGNRDAVKRCEPSLKNVKVHDNTIVQTVGGAAGLAGKIDQDKVWTSWGNQFHNNTYTLSSGVQFRWKSSWVSYQQWQNNGQN